MCLPRAPPESALERCRADGASDWRTRSTAVFYPGPRSLKTEVHPIFMRIYVCAFVKNS